MNSNIRTCIQNWLSSRLSAEEFGWVEDSQELISSGATSQLYLRFGLASRKISKQDLELTDDELQQAESVRPNWKPETWSRLDAVRALFVGTLPNEAEDAYLGPINQLFQTGEVGELVSLYQSLPLLSYPEQLVERAAEGIRTNMRSVFAAVAHNNSYPSEYLPEGLWNQMVLKCLFVELSLYPIIGLDSRKNRNQSQMLSDYARERWAAKRTIPVELWRCVSVDLYPESEQDFKRVLEQGTELEQQAAVLSLLTQSTAIQDRLLTDHAEMREAGGTGKLTWQQIYEAVTSES